ncbi:MAG TPA: class I SAM-dependent methyltransferase [Casimicrobiaceae bacterium]
MANFVPLKQYMLYCLDRFVERYGLAPPFLEVGCGKGDVSVHLAKKGWPGLAIDFSDVAIVHAQRALAAHPQVAVRRQTLSETRGAFATILVWDVLEHIEDDRAALHAIADLLVPGGQVLIAVPSNPREWRWDDAFYGHFRRYTVEELAAKLADAGMQSQAFWDFTYPLFWALRRAYTRMKRPPRAFDGQEAATRASATVSAWELPLVSRVLDGSALLWRPLHPLQFRLFRHATARGHEFFALARKA